MNEEENEKLRRDFERFAYGILWSNEDEERTNKYISHRISNLSEWLIYKLDQALTDKVATIRGDINKYIENRIPGFKRCPMDPMGQCEKCQMKRDISTEILSLPSLSLPASREENGTGN